MDNEVIEDLRKAVVIQILTGTLIFAVGFTCSALSHLNRQDDVNLGCTYGTGIWVGLAAIVVNCAGLSTTYRPVHKNKRRRRLVCGYFVLTLVSSGAAGILFSFSLLWSVTVGKYGIQLQQHLNILSCYALNVLLAILSVQYVLTSLWITALLYNQWSQEGSVAGDRINLPSEIALTEIAHDSKLMPTRFAASSWTPFSSKPSDPKVYTMSTSEEADIAFACAGEKLQELKELAAYILPAADTK